MPGWSSNVHQCASIHSHGIHMIAMMFGFPWGDDQDDHGPFIPWNLPPAEANGKRRPRRGTMWTRSHSFQGGGASRSWEILEQFSDFHHGILKVFPTGLTLSSWCCPQAWSRSAYLAPWESLGPNPQPTGGGVPQNDLEIFPHWAVPRVGVPPYHHWFPIIQNDKNDLRYLKIPRNSVITLAPLGNPKWWLCHPPVPCQDSRRVSGAWNFSADLAGGSDLTGPGTLIHKGWYPSVTLCDLNLFWPKHAKPYAISPKQNWNNLTLEVSNMVNGLSFNSTQFKTSMQTAAIFSLSLAYLH